MSLSSEQIQSIRERVDIVRVIGARVQLRKQGLRHIGLCPFHDEDTPSFSVSPEKGLYYCFGCHAGGDVFSFVMRHQGLDFHAAVRLLATQAGIPVEAESPAALSRRKSSDELSQVNQYAQAFFEHALWQTNGGAAARAYVLARGIPEPQAHERQLGYGGSSGDLLGYLQAKKVPPALAARAGLLSDDGRRCLFEGRLTFPLVDQDGRWAGFGGRCLEEGATPKYINSRESPLFAKRRLLYGWDVAQEAMRKTGRVIVVEGYLDVLACQRAGMPQTVAALGTAFTSDHASLCARLAKEAVLVFDGDPAGVRATREVAQRLLAAKLKTLVVALPTGHDPDSLVKEQGTGALRQCLEQAVPAVEHYLSHAFADRTLSIEDRAALARDLLPLLTSLSTGLEQDLYMARLAECVGVSPEQLRRHMAGTRPRRSQATGRSAGAPPRKADTTRSFDHLETSLLRHLLLYPQLRQQLGALVEYCSDPMRLLLSDLAASQEPTATVLARHIPDPLTVRNLVPSETFADEDNEAEHAQQTLLGALNRLKGRQVNARLQELRLDLQAMEAKGEDTSDILRSIQSLTRRKRELRGSGTDAPPAELERV